MREKAVMGLVGVAADPDFTETLIRPTLSPETLNLGHSTLNPAPQTLHRQMRETSCSVLSLQVLEGP